jgi:REP element-mobilizing transposase RayT
VAPNRALHESDAAQAVAPPAELSPEERRVVQTTIEEHCTFRGWPLLAVNVRTNHVHVVLQCPVPPETAMSQFKSWATRRLREAGHVREKLWTRHGSTVYLWTADQVHAKVDYVKNRQ